MNKLLAIFFLLIISCQPKESNKPFWAYYKSDLQNGLYRHESSKFISSNMSQIVEEAQKTYEPEVLASIMTLQNRTSKIIQYLDALSEQMIETNGGIDPEIGIAINRDEPISLSNQFYTNGKGKELQNNLIKYSNFLSSYGLKNSTIAVEPKNVIQLKNDPAYHDSSFIELHFEDKNIFEAISSIEYFKISILLKESTTVGLIMARN